jgi:CRP-like cAMP-binding protein
MKTCEKIPAVSCPGETGIRPPNSEKLIASHPFLTGLSPHHLRLLSDCAMFTMFEPGQVIFREGDPANRFYLIRSGKIVLESHTKTLGSIPIQTVSDGEILGWSWLFAPYYWHFDARAVEKTEAIFYYGTPLRTECENDHDFGYEMYRRMAEVLVNRLQATRRQLLNPPAVLEKND